MVDKVYRFLWALAIIGGVFIDTDLMGLIPGLIMFGIFKSIFFGDKKKKKEKVSEARNEVVAPAKAKLMYRELRKYFQNHDEVELCEGVYLRPANDEVPPKGKISLDVYADDEFICRFEEYGQYFKGSYLRLIDTVLEKVTGEKVVEEPVKQTKTTKSYEEKQKRQVKEEKQPEVDKNSTNYYIDMIEKLNVDIPDEDITKGLYETTAMLKQIKLIEDRYPDAKEKLGKMYSYYLPILVNILTSYEKLSNTNRQGDDFAKSEDKLKKTIMLVNEALRSLTATLCEEDIVDLNSDMSVLETILRKDGLVKDGTIHQNQEG